jgi:hypothetical protein
MRTGNTADVTADPGHRLRQGFAITSMMPRRSCRWLSTSQSLVHEATMQIDL